MSPGCPCPLAGIVGYQGCKKRDEDPPEVSERHRFPPRSALQPRQHQQTHEVCWLPAGNNPQGTSPDQVQLASPAQCLVLGKSFRVGKASRVKNGEKHSDSYKLEAMPKQDFSNTRISHAHTHTHACFEFRRKDAISLKTKQKRKLVRRDFSAPNFLWVFFFFPP